MARRSLRDIELNPRPARARSTLFVVVGLRSAAAAIGYVVPGHRVDESTYHSNFADGGYLPLVILLLCAILAGLLSRARFGAGIAIGLISFVVAMLGVWRWMFAHQSAMKYSIYGDMIHGLGLVSMSLTAIALVTTDLVLFHSARSALERGDLKIPPARVVS